VVALLDEELLHTPEAPGFALVDGATKKAAIVGAAR